MLSLRESNLELLEKYRLLKHHDSFSLPLLVSSNEEYLEKIEQAPTKVLYVGQETNCWINYHNDDVDSCEAIEEVYFDKLLRTGTSKRAFWTFIRNILQVEHKKIGENVIWSNSLIAGKRREIGAPSYAEELHDISVQNLFFLYQYFKPDLTILASGPNNPYYQINTDFLGQINSSLVGLYPKRRTPLICDEDKKILWTYHPGYLHRLGIKEELENTIRVQYVKRKNN